MPKRMIENEGWYDLDPPAQIGKKVFRRVLCEYQVPGHPNEFSVRGVPDGGSKEEPFILRFTPNGKVRPFLSANQTQMRLVWPES